MQPSSELLIQIQELKNAAMCFRAINHKLRQQILQLVHKKGKITVTDLYKKLAIEQSVASQHLAILRQQGFVTTQRQERFIFYSINYQRIKEVEAFAGELLEVKEHINVMSLKPGIQLMSVYEHSAFLLAVKKALGRV